MRPSVLLLLGIRLIFAGKHSLKYFYISVSGGDDEFTAVGLVDGHQFMYFDINTKKASPKTEWIVRQNENTDYWDRQTALMIHEHNWIKKKHLDKVSKYAGHAITSMHTYQLTYGCEWNDETGEINGFRQYGYDGEDFLFLDLKREKWISPVEEGFNTQEMCNNNTIRLEYWKHYLEIECIETLKKFLQLEKSSLKKTVSPQVSLLQKNASSPVLCHVTGFYPSNVRITWMKNGLKHYEDVKDGVVLPNEDKTFQKTVTLKAEPDEWRKDQYSCVVKHKSKTIRKTLRENEIRTNNDSSAPDGMTVAFVSVGILLIIIAVLGFVVYQKKGKSGFVWASISDGGSEYSSLTHE